jgi:DNA polymerase
MKACKVTSCNLCPASKKGAPTRADTRKRIVNGVGEPQQPLMMIVVDAPSRDDDNMGEYATGDIGTQLMEAVRRAGVNTDDVFIVGANRCHLPGRATNRKEQEACRPYLEQDIAATKPAVIVPMGTGALWSILRKEGITAQHGSVFDTEWGIPAVATFSPASLFHNAGNIEYIIADIAKAARVAEGVETPELGEYSVALDVDEVECVRDILVEEPLVAFDFETWDNRRGGLNPRAPMAQILCASFACQAAEGFTIPLVGWHLEEIWTTKEKRFVEDCIRDILTSSADKVAANGKFDLAWARYALNCRVTNYYDDSQYGYAIHHEERPHSLEHQRIMFTNMPRYESFKDDPAIREMMKELSPHGVAWGYAGIPTDYLWNYAAADVDCVLRVHEVNMQKLSSDSHGVGGPFYRPARR